jgi:hypothetical protein
MADQLVTRDDQLAAVIAKSVAQATAEAVVKVQERTQAHENKNPPRDSWNETPGVLRPTLSRRTVFCGAEQKERQLLTEEILLFNQLQPGRYHNRRWEVIERDEGSDGKAIEVRIPVATVDDRMSLPSLVEILKEIVQEGKARKPA